MVDQEEGKTVRKVHMHTNYQLISSTCLCYWLKSCHSSEQGEEKNEFIILHPLSAPIVVNYAFYLYTISSDLRQYAVIQLCV